MNEQFNNTNQISTEAENSVSESTIATVENIRVCPSCNSSLAEEQKFCPNCGATVEEKNPQTLLCTNCNAEIPSETKFCPKCGIPIVLPSCTTMKEKSLNKKKLLLIGGIVAAVIVITTIIILCFAFREIPVEDIVLSESKIELKEEETKNISCTVYPEKATDKTVIWTSSDSSVATVNSYGMITAIGKGTCTITAQSGDQTETISVTVKIKGPDFNKLYNEIDSDVKYGWELGSDGSYLMADTNVYDLDDYSNSAIWYSIKDMNKKLGLPDSFNNDLAQTTWSMGRQNKVFDSVGIEVTWTYHPDKGMEVTYKLINN